MTSAARMPLTGLPLAGTGRRSAALAAWATAHVRGTVSTQRALDAVHGDDEPHLVLGLDGGDDLRAVFAELGRRGADGLRLVLPVPGDPRGIPAPGPLTARALDAGEAVLVQGGEHGYGLVPTITGHGSDAEGITTVVTWHAVPCPAPVPEPRGTLRQTEHDLADALRTAAAELLQLDVASLSPRAAQRLVQLRSGTRRPLVVLPASHPAAGRHLLDQAERLAEVVEIAGDDDGAAVDVGTAQARRETLRSLAAVVRRARVVAVNAPLDC